MEQEIHYRIYEPLSLGAAETVSGGRQKILAALLNWARKAQKARLARTLPKEIVSGN
jgi:hypothetical protein